MSSTGDAFVLSGDFRGASLYIKSLVGLARSTGGIPYQPPRVLPEFVGRVDELAQLDELLVPGQSVGITGLIGMGGLGKTELAKLSASRAIDHFRDGVLWADCASQSLATIADLWAAEYGVEIPGEDNTSKASAWRSLVSGKETLLIFDDVQPDQPVDLLFPPRGRSAVLITTRYADHPALHDADILRLDQFSPEEASALTEKVLGSEFTRQQAADAHHLFELIGYLPLGIAIALHLSQSSGWSLATLTRQLEARGALTVLGDREKLHKSLNATFETAWSALPRELQDTFATLAIFNCGPSFSTFALADTLLLDEAEASARLHHLAGRSLLKHQGQDRWSLHELLREYAACRSTPDDAIGIRFAVHYQKVGSLANAVYLQGGDNCLRGLALFDLESPHIHASQAWAAVNMKHNIEVAKLCSDYPSVMAHLMDLRFSMQEQISWLEIAVLAAQQLGEKKAETTHLGNLGNAHLSAGNARRAIQYYTEVLALIRGSDAGVTQDPAQCVENRKREGNVLSGLGMAFGALRNHRKAIKCHKEALNIYRQTSAVCDKESAEWVALRRDEGKALGYLGNEYFALKKSHLAITYYKEALEIAQEIGDRRSEGEQLGSLGLAYTASMGLQEGIGYFRQGLAISEEIGDRRNIAIQLGNVGTAYHRMGEIHQAIEYYERALILQREIGDRVNEGNVLRNLGMAYTELDDPNHAHRYLAEALAVFESLEDPRAGDVRILLLKLRR